MERSLPENGIYLLVNTRSKNMAAVEPHRGGAELRRQRRLHPDENDGLGEDSDIEDFEDSPIVAKTDDLDDMHFAQV
jgi:hypothetical protein